MGWALHVYVPNNVLQNPKGIHKWVFHFVTPQYMCTENGGVSECYTGINGGPTTTRRKKRKVTLIKHVSVSQL